LKGLTGAEFDKKKAELVADYETKFANPYKAASLGYVDEVIYPENTRSRIYKYLEFLKNKNEVRPNRKHGNIPL
jgi:propionyl-CoA carboxylase beta chain